MGAARRLVLGGAILGLFWSGLPRYGVAKADNGQLSKACKPSPCTCDDYGRLTCDCKGQDLGLTLTSEGENRMSPHTIRISVSDCPSLTITKSGLSSMTGLRSIDLSMIGNLNLTMESFRLSLSTLRARISIRDAWLPVLPSFVFHGDVESISFENVTINRVEAFAFVNLFNTDTLRLENCQIDVMKGRAFQRFDVNYLHVIGGSLGKEILSRTMYDINVSTSFILDGVSMGIVRSSGFVITKPRTVAIQNCIVENLEAKALDITARGAVIIKNNNFVTLSIGAFLGIRIDTDARNYQISGGSGRTSLPEMSFTNNSLVNFDEGSVMFDRSSFRPIIENVFVNRTCNCSMLAVWKNNVLNYTNLYGKFYTSESSGQSSSSIGWLKDVEPIEENRDTFLCSDDSSDVNSVAVTFVDYEMKKCLLGNSIMIFALLIVAIVILIGCTITAVVWYCKKQRNDDRKKWISVPTSAPDVVTSKKNGVIGRETGAIAGGNNAPVDSRITMVVPDGRLYRETEFHVIVEKTEPLTTEL